MRFIFFILTICVIFTSCSKKIDKKRVVLEIGRVSELNVNSKYIDSISYEYDYEMTDYSSSYELYIDKVYFDSVIIKLIRDNPKFIFYNNNVFSCSISEGACTEQVNIFPKDYLIFYAKDCL